MPPDHNGRSRPAGHQAAPNDPDEEVTASLPPDHDVAVSPHCSPAACALANLATADLLARARVSWASRDVADVMVSTGLLERVTKAIGQPVSPEHWIAFYKKRAADLAEKLEPRRRELRAGRAPRPTAASDFDNAEHRGAAEMRQRLADRADRLGITDLDVRHPGWNGRAGFRARGLRLEGDQAPRDRDATVSDIGEARRD